MGKGNRPLIIAGVVGAVLVIAFGIYQFSGTSSKTVYVGSIFASADDGKTFFVTDQRSLPPFTSEKGEAVRAYVFEAKNSRFVGYLMKYTPEARTRLAEKLKTSDPRSTAAILAQATPDEIMFKAPGSAGHWIKASDPTVASVLIVKGPGGAMAVSVDP